MTDIVERLRAFAGDTPGWAHAIFGEAADEIERLRTRLAIQFGMHPGGDLAKAAQAEIERLRGIEQFATEASRQERDGLRAEIERLLDALKVIECHSIDHTDACRMAGKARRALEPKP